MGTFDVRDMMKADAAAAATPALFGGAEKGQTRRFHPLAERIAAIPVKPTLSPVMIEGVARLLDLIAVLGAGGLVYWFYAAGKVEPFPYQVTVGALAVGGGPQLVRAVSRVGPAQFGFEEGWRLIGHGVVGRREAHLLRLGRTARRRPAAAHRQARVGSGGIDPLDEAHHATVSFTSTPGRWHIGSGLDCVCRSVPRSNLRGSCLAYSGWPTVLTVSLKSAGAK